MSEICIFLVVEMELACVQLYKNNNKNPNKNEKRK